VQYAGNGQGAKAKINKLVNQKIGQKGKKRRAACSLKKKEKTEGFEKNAVEKSLQPERTRDRVNRS